MCFSATASFGAGIVLTGVGVSCIAQTRKRKQVPFAAIPIIFAVQQFSEGFLWLAFDHEDWMFLKTPMTYLFLFFAQVFWPFWVPYSILQLEPSHKKRWNLERVLLSLGLIMSGYLGYCLLLFNVEAKAVGHHIVYIQDYPKDLSLFAAGIYFIAIILPPFFSGIKSMWTIGTAIFISYVITAIFHKEYLISVWCFFAAIISVSILVILFDMKRSHSHSQLSVSHSRI